MTIITVANCRKVSITAEVDVTRMVVVLPAVRLPRVIVRGGHGDAPRPALARAELEERGVWAPVRSVELVNADRVDNELVESQYCSPQSLPTDVRPGRLLKASRAAVPQSRSRTFGASPDVLVADWDFAALTLSQPHCPPGVTSLAMKDCLPRCGNLQPECGLLAKLAA